MKIIEENYDELTHLPTDLMLPWLFVENVISGKEKEEIAFLPTNGQKIEYLLNDIIMPSLQANVIVKFKRFLKMIEDTDNPLLIDMMMNFSK